MAATVTTLPWLPAAESVLRQNGFPSATLGAPELLRTGPRHQVYRCPVAEGPAPTVIAKVMAPVSAEGFTEWASLAFLAELETDMPLAPRFIGGDKAAGLFLMTDLGPGSTLESSLQGRDLGRFLADLESLAVVSAQLHRRTVCLQDRFGELRTGLPLAQGVNRQAEALRWWGGRDRIEAWCDAAGIEAPPGIYGGMRDVTAVYADPGPFLTFTHGDPAPTNNHCGPSGVHLLDFEYGGFRHALYDVTAWYVLCPLPEAIVDSFLQAYRSGLGGVASEAEDAAFATAFAQMTVYRALAMLQWIPPDILVDDRPWVGDWSCRAAVLAVLNRMVAVTAEVPALGPLALAADRLYEALTKRWPEIGDPLPPWPVFQALKT